MSVLFGYLFSGGVVAGRDPVSVMVAVMSGSGGATGGRRRSIWVRAHRRRARDTTLLVQLSERYKQHAKTNTYTSYYTLLPYKKRRQSQTHSIRWFGLKFDNSQRSKRFDKFTNWQLFTNFSRTMHDVIEIIVWSLNWYQLRNSESLWFYLSCNKSCVALCSAGASRQSGKAHRWGSTRRALRPTRRTRARECLPLPPSLFENFVLF